MCSATSPNTRTLAISQVCVASAHLGEQAIGSNNSFVRDDMVLGFEISRKIQYMRGLCGANRSHFQTHLFPSTIVCVDSISEVSLTISRLPTEQKTASER